MECIRAVLAEDNAALRAMLAEELSAQEDIEVLGAAADGAKLVELCREHRPDVAVLDIRMPVMDGVAAARLLRRELPDIRLLVLTTFDDEDYLRELFGIGIDGYLLKNYRPGALAGAVRSVYQGINTLDVEVSRKLGGMLNTSAPAQAQQGALTEMERKVAGLIARGCYNKDIAVELDISYGRVRNIVSQVYRKMGVVDRAGLVARLNREREK